MNISHINKSIRRCSKKREQYRVLLRILEGQICYINWTLRFQMWELDEKFKTHSELEKEKNALLLEYHRLRRAVEDCKKSLAYYRTRLARDLEIQQKVSKK